MSCPAYWNRRVQQELSPAFSLVKFIQARAYARPKILDRVALPAIAPMPGDPIKQMRKFLKNAYDPTSPQDDLIIMYHRAGGFSHVRQSECL